MTSQEFELLATSSTYRSLRSHQYRPSGQSNGFLQVLLHGATYDHRYWQIGTVNGRNYSYVDYMAARGYTLLSFDLPGTDGKTGADVSFDGLARAIADAVARIRAGTTHMPAESFRNGIALIGHSLGGTLATYLQGHYRPTDLLVVMSTGFGPERGASFGDSQDLYEQDEAYIAVPPQQRADRFFHSDGVDPAVVEWDNAHLRRTVSLKLWREAIEARNSRERSGVFAIQCPTLIQLGEHDPVMPGRVARMESNYWGGRSTVMSIPDTGHCINQHLAREFAWAGVDRFIARSERASNPTRTAATT